MPFKEERNNVRTKEKKVTDTFFWISNVARIKIEWKMMACKVLFNQHRHHV